MKILRKISLRRGLYRIMQPNPSFPKITQSLFKEKQTYQLSPEDQLQKYGVKPRHTETKWIYTLILGSLTGFFAYNYLYIMYQNQLDTIYRYRYHQQQNSALKLYIRILFLKFFVFLESNYFFTAFLKKNKMGKNQHQPLTQGIIRFQQYQHYKKNKNRLFDFLDIGVMEKFPYAKQQPQMG